MKRTNLYLPLPLLAKMKALADASGMSVSELVRRSIEAYLAKRK